MAVPKRLNASPDLVASGHQRAGSGLQHAGSGHQHAGSGHQHAGEGGSRTEQDGLLALQRLAGNRAVTQALAGTVGHEQMPLAVQRFVTYRGGKKQRGNMTPRAADKTGNKKGLSTFEELAGFPSGFKGTEAQAIETDSLGSKLKAVRNGTRKDDSHVSILPVKEEELDAWADKKSPEYPAYSDAVMAAVTGAVDMPSRD